jgi:hypothetical protein
VKITVNSPDGSENEADAPAEMYTHIKWVADRNISPGETGNVSFKVKVK